MSHIDEFRVNFFLYGCVLLFLNLFLHLNNLFLIFDASEGLEQVAHIVGNLLADSDSVFKSTLFSSIICPSASQNSITTVLSLSFSYSLNAALMSAPQLIKRVNAWVKGAVSNHSGGLRLYSSLLSLPFFATTFLVFFLGRLSWAAILSSIIFLAQSFQWPSFFI